jgi:hypothetical protein
MPAGRIAMTKAIRPPAERRRLIGQAGAAALVMLALAACQPEPSGLHPDIGASSQTDEAASIGSGSAFQMVDCILPGRVRRAGRGIIQVEQPSTQQTTLWDCGIRGGEYVLRDPAHAETALLRLEPLAENGDQEAQLAVAEIQESRGNYAAAVGAYQQAADQGNASAELWLAGTYNEGVMVPKDEAKAREFARRATGLDDPAPVLEALGPPLVEEPEVVDWLASADPMAFDYGRYYALIIGNADYPRSAGGPLRTPINDAKAVAEILETRYGFRVNALENADRPRIFRALDIYRQRLRSSDNLLIYYAGHGHWDEAARDAYWLPAGQAAGRVDWISTTDITNELRTIPAKKIMVIADSCYAGALSGGSVVRPQQPPVDDRIAWLQLTIAEPTRTVLTSGGIKPVLDGGGGSNHSIFALSLLSRLKANDKIMSGLTLYYQVGAEVVWRAGSFDQRPTYNIIDVDQNRYGEFFFVPNLTTS